ncbi:hypothetical protein TSL1_03150 [Sulfurovum sp. TSL1]|nr:hypothetical protein TSL1_03150 [Sulfurovum sp. TSL1]
MQRIVLDFSVFLGTDNVMVDIYHESTKIPYEIFLYPYKI